MYPILQFGTGRFLQAHVDLFVSEALATGKALGRIAAVQTTDNAASVNRVAALATGVGHRVEIRGLRGGVAVAETVIVDSIGTAWSAGRDWERVLQAVASDVRVIVSNTADRGYELSEADRPDAAPPASFPAKLVVLLYQRWRHVPRAPLTIYPCELVQRNGDTLREIVVKLASSWRRPDGFVAYLREQCVWVNSLVDRIVSGALHPVGAIAEPYALWAIEQQDRMILPCEHPAMVVTNELAKYERLKLMLLNLGHSVLAERWLAERRSPDETVRAALSDDRMADELEAVWNDEVLPVFDAIGEGAAARTYLSQVRDRLRNPFLEHRLSDIANNHAEKKRWRFAPVIALAERHALRIEQPRLRAALASEI